MKRKFLFVNWKFALTVAAMAALSFAFIDGTTPADEGDFFESDFDGLWVGVIPFDDDLVPALISVNTQGEGGLGYAVIVEDTSKSFQEFASATLQDVSAKGKKLDFTVTVPLDDDETDLEFSLSLKDDTLKGDYDSKDLGKEKVEMFRLNGHNLLQHIWVGDNKGTPAALQIEGENDDLKIEVFINNDFADLENAAFDGKKLTGTIEEKNETIGDLSLKHNSKKQLLKGVINLDDGGKVKAKMLPVGGSGKKMKFSSVSPNTITLSGGAPAAMTALTIKGKNFQPGAMIHLDYADAEVMSVAVEKSTITAMVMVPETAANGTKISVLVVNPDNQQGERTDAITIVKEDDGGNGTTFSFANDIQPIFNNNCATCHVPGSSGGLNLGPTNAFNRIVNVNGSAGFAYISPNNPDDSYIIMKLRGDSRISGSQMPQGRTPLSPDVINRIVTWINEGAQNN